jgi:hypothetical protein
MKPYADLSKVLTQLGEMVSEVSNIISISMYNLEFVSKELNHLAAILHVYAGGLNFMK